VNSFPVKIEKDDVGEDDEDTEELKIEVHGRTNTSLS
jgi:hypothetical protein